MRKTDAETAAADRASTATMASRALLATSLMLAGLVVVLASRSIWHPTGNAVGRVSAVVHQGDARVV